MTAAYFSDIEWKDAVAITGSAYGAFDAPCPVCSPGRKPANRRAKVFRVWREAADFARYNCCHCSLHGVVFRDPLPATADNARPQRRDWAAEERARLERTAAAERELRLKTYEAEFIFFSANRIEGSPAETYLASRGLKPGLDLRFARFCPFGERSAPAMIAAVRDASGTLKAIQRTFLSPEGQKIKRLSYGPVGDGAIRLAEIGDDGVLAVAEGVEDALAFSALYSIPTWSTLGKGGIRRFQPPPGLRRLVVAADNDPDGGGLDAAHDLAKRASAICEVAIMAPKRAKDWADVLTEIAA